MFFFLAQKSHSDIKDRVKIDPGTREFTTKYYT